ncbi:MAG: tetratricopeptide repeat protein [Candidatus Krumholzibacteria bacterium]|nr:tetratricopeptide repeat protein [Candidatus Krumholzibacteria bacterium]
MSRSIPAALLVLFLLLAGCSRSYYDRGLAASEKGDYDQALALLYKAVQEKPDDHRAWRELGMAWYRTDSLGKAEEAFAASNRISPNALSNFYLGLIFERTGEIDKAIRVYGAAANLQGDGRTRKLIRDRLGVLIDGQLAADARRAVRGEDTLSVRSLPNNSIAVINFNGTYLPRDIQPMALGLAEFVAMDLSKISSLKVLERIKINVILDELKLGESSYADSRLAPRMGKLLGSRNIVLGAVTGVGESGFRIDGLLVNTVDGDIRGAQSREGDLNRFFDVEKKFVFALLDTLGIEISKTERDAIEEVPTESFLAFMAFSKGLSYERRGMYDDAMNSFRDAGNQDHGFIQASSLMKKMETTSSYGKEMKGDPSSRAKSFEQEVAPSIRPEGEGTDTGRIQAANLVNGNFIMNDELYWDYGSYPVAPPGGGPIWNGYGIIIIRGHLDAK